MICVQNPVLLTNELKMYKCIKTVVSHLTVTVTKGAFPTASSNNYGVSYKVSNISIVGHSVLR